MTTATRVALKDMKTAGLFPEHAGIVPPTYTGLRLTIPAREALEAWVDLGPRPDLEPATFRKRVQRALSRLRAAWGTVT